MSHHDVLVVINMATVILLMAGCGPQPYTSPVAPPPEDAAATSTPLPSTEVSAPRTSTVTLSPLTVTSTPGFDTTEIEPEQQQLPDSPKLNKQTDCPDLESTLFQITQSPDPLRLAEQLQLKIKEDKVQVLLILVSEGTSFLQKFEVDIGTQVGVQVQAFVPINQLCNLANATEVLAVRLPAEAAPQK